MNLWLQDPNTKNSSVSLTLLMISFLGVLTAAGLQLAKLTDSTSVMTEVFYSCLALYFGRRFTINGKTFSSDSSQIVNEVVNDIQPVAPTTTVPPTQQ